MTTDIVFMDTETLGLDLDAPIWEFAAIRRRMNDPDEPSMFGDDPWIEEELHLFIQHDPDGWIEPFEEQVPDMAADYRERFDEGNAFSRQGAAHSIASFLGGRPLIVGAVPNFDTERISRQLLAPRGILDPWHYHLIDVENVVFGYLRSVRHEDGAPRDQIDRLTTLPLSSDLLSAAVGVDPTKFPRHTAMGDVRWVRAQWDAVMGGAK
ncbi:hypothetical protein [Mycobacterium sp. DL440]|uniref:hypothetical protein n=1 Tax=Mycobacterium sp. DL440 TaxID=2675523 RepID=UPI001FBB2C12|nr:hypothetical protein [Mycobacterium sp. DL440]